MKNRKLEILVTILVSIVLCACSSSKPLDLQSPNDLLKDVLANLKKIETAAYNAKMTAFAPFDTIPTYVVGEYVMEYRNEQDTFLSAKFVRLPHRDSAQMTGCYDGQIRTLIYEEHKGMVIDSFKINKHPGIRPVSAPFFTFTERLIEYILDTKDSSSLVVSQMDDTLMFAFEVYDTVVEIIGTKIVYTPALPGTSHKDLGDVSRYNLWVSQKDMLPFKYERNMPHNISLMSVSEVELNTMDIDDLVVADYFPRDYEVRQYSEGRKPNPHKLTGKKAPAWSLESAYGDSITLADMKGKVTLIEFTSVTCGPCKVAIPFLDKLDEEYSVKDFAFVSIETLDRSSRALRKYQERHRFDFPFLKSDKKIREDYQVGPTPTFMIIDRAGVIRKVLQGYGKGKSEELIREAINALI